MNCFECVTFNSGNPCKSWAGGDICEKFEEAETRTKEQVKKAENRRGKKKNNQKHMHLFSAFYF